MLFNLLDAARPNPIDMIMALYEESALYVIIPVAVFAICTIAIIAIASSRERREDKKRKEEYKKNNQN